MLDIKRATISVRLSERESQLLRLRAAESGMSVSGYMRSCVLEAEHLRFQVKQALAEIRARAQELEPARLPAPPSPEGEGIWTRWLSKTAEFLLGLWYPRHRSV